MLQGHCHRGTVSFVGDMDTRTKHICDPYAFVTILLSQLYNLRSLRLYFTFGWQSGFPGLMVRHALLSALLNTLSRFSEFSLFECGLNFIAPRLYESTNNLKLELNYIDGLQISPSMMAW